ncbi:type II toxin-antitoxin system PemK/MazF family toxin [Cupriavidus plantarum]|uniref:type II toxin-antitoxin system PemK/MazF family toxin n=1 Tax=Cupriavidus plantarum TaxID=942865 RepID=UPI001C6387F7|nr:type II toxin-antitoxin system PemK/MazF family toxin [Cupriavidus plantarum]
MSSRTSTWTSIQPSTYYLSLANFADTPAFRIRGEPDEQNGLREISEIMVDKLQSPLRTKIGKVIGRLDSGRMAEIDRALTVWLGIV